MCLHSKVLTYECEHVRVIILEVHPKIVEQTESRACQVTRLYPWRGIYRPIGKDRVVLLYLTHGELLVVARTNLNLLSVLHPTVVQQAPTEGAADSAELDVCESRVPVSRFLPLTVSQFSVPQINR